MWVWTHFKLCIGSVASKTDLLVTTCLYFISELGIEGDS